MESPLSGECELYYRPTCPLHVAPQPVLEASVVKCKVRPGAEGAATLLGDTLSQCTAARCPPGSSALLGHVPT